MVAEARRSRKNINSAKADSRIERTIKEAMSCSPEKRRMMSEDGVAVSFTFRDRLFNRTQRYDFTVGDMETILKKAPANVQKHGRYKLQYDSNGEKIIHLLEALANSISGEAAELSIPLASLYLDCEKVLGATEQEMDGIEDPLDLAGPNRRSGGSKSVATTLLGPRFAQLDIAAKNINEFLHANGGRHGFAFLNSTLTYLRRHADEQDKGENCEEGDDGADEADTGGRAEGESEKCDDGAGD